MFQPIIHGPQRFDEVKFNRLITKFTGQKAERELGQKSRAWDELEG